MTEDQSTQSDAEDRSDACLILICGDAQATNEGLDLSAIGSRLPARVSDVEVSIIAGSCKRPDAVGEALESSSAQHLVIGACSGDFPAIEVHSRMRRRGIDALGLQLVEIGSGDAPKSANRWITAGAELLLIAAVARAKAFPGSLPENQRATLATSGTRVSRRALFTLPPISYETAPTIAMNRCAADDGCTRCVDACPHDAMKLFGDRVTVDRSQCTSCGICVAVCPHRTVEYPGASIGEVEHQIESLLSAE